MLGCKCPGAGPAVGIPLNLLSGKERLAYHSYGIAQHSSKTPPATIRSDPSNLRCLGEYILKGCELADQSARTALPRPPPVSIHPALPFPAPPRPTLSRSSTPPCIAPIHSVQPSPAPPRLDPPRPALPRHAIYPQDPHPTPTPTFQTFPNLTAQPASHGLRSTGNTPPIKDTLQADRFITGASRSR